MSDSIATSSEEKQHQWAGYFKTAIANTAPGHVWVRGYPVEDLMGTYSFAELVALVLKGELPGKSEAILMDALLGSILSHGFDDTSEPVARFTASGNPSPIAACAAGILSIGTFQGGAARTTAEFLIEKLAAFDHPVTAAQIDAAAEQIARECIETRFRIPGFGHPVHKEADPRARRLFEIADEHELAGPHTRLYRAIHRAFVAQRGKHIVINADGAAGALLVDLDYDPLYMEVLIALSFLPGILASAVEEIRHGVPFRVLPDAIAEYVGPAPRPVPAKKG